MALSANDRGLFEQKIDQFTSDSTLRAMWKQFTSTKENFFWYLKGSTQASCLGIYNVVHGRNPTDEESKEIWAMVDRRFKVVSDKITDLPDY